MVTFPPIGCIREKGCVYGAVLAKGHELDFDHCAHVANAWN
jgi:hypothetical protein